MYTNNVIKNAISDLTGKYKLNTTKLIVYLDILKSYSYTFIYYIKNK